MQDARLLSFFLTEQPGRPRRGPPSADDPREDGADSTRESRTTRTAYDMREVVQHVVDDSEFFEVQELFARNMVCGFARIGGSGQGGKRPAGTDGAGTGIESIEKTSRFIRTCDAFNVPILTFCDVPGFARHRRSGTDHPSRRQVSTPTRRRRSQS